MRTHVTRSTLLTILIGLVLGCAAGGAVTTTVAAAAAPKSPSAPRLVLNAQGVEVLSFSVPVSLAVFNTYTPGVRVSTDNGATFAALVGLTCTSAGTNAVSCSGPFPLTVKGTYQTKVQVCDTQGAKQKCSTSAAAAIDFLPTPATPTAPTCPNCSPGPPPVTIAIVSPPAGRILAGIADVTFDTTGVVLRADVEVRDQNDQFVCTCTARMVPGAPIGQRWLVQLDTPKAANASYSVIATAWDSANVPSSSGARLVAIFN